MESVEFLNLIFPDDMIGAGRRLVIWSAPDKASRFFTEIPKAAAYAAARTGQNVYFGLGLIAGTPKGRGKLADVAAIGCLWADIDVAGPGHKKTNLPPDRQAALALLNRVGLHPSIVVDSGHGLQVYWLLKEPLILEDAAERHQAATLARRWVNTIRAVAWALKYDLDAVGDLTRVFRLPGTQNLKDTAQPVPVRVLTANDLRYAPDDFDMFLVAEEHEPGSEPAVAVDAVVLHSDAEPPTAKLLALMDNEPRFKQSYYRTRADMQDQSASAYDMSLATFAVICDWTDQEVANLIIAHRRYHKDIAKGLRRDYVMRTIARAKTGAAHDQAVVDLAGAAEKLATARSDTPAGTEAPGVKDKREKLLQTISKMLGVDISQWVQHGLENARYSLVLADGRWIRMGAVENVLAARKFRAAIYETTRQVVKTFKAKQWDDVCRCLGAVVEIVENVEATSGYQAQQWIRSYTDDHPPAEDGDWREAARMSEPFIREGLLHIHAGELRKHMRMIDLERGVSHVDLCDCLKVSGFKRTSVSLRQGEQVTSRSYWVKKADSLYREKKVAPPGK